MKGSDTEVREQRIWLSHMLPFLSLSFGMCFCGGLFLGICSWAPGRVGDFQGAQGVPHLQAQVSGCPLVWWDVCYSHGTGCSSECLHRFAGAFKSI